MAVLQTSVFVRQGSFSFLEAAESLEDGNLQKLGFTQVLPPPSNLQPEEMKEEVSSHDLWVLTTLPPRLRSPGPEAVVSREGSRGSTAVVPGRAP